MPWQGFDLTTHISTGRDDTTRPGSPTIDTFLFLRRTCMRQRLAGKIAFLLHN
jgi:hypothetical protein